MQHLNGASIVIQSISSNWPRLLTTMLLNLMLMYFFAIMGIIVWQPDHIADPTHMRNSASNTNGPCANLLTCFVTYSMTGASTFIVRGLACHSDTSKSLIA
jgi:hypothetical protein